MQQIPVFSTSFCKFTRFLTTIKIRIINFNNFFAVGDFLTKPIKMVGGVSVKQ